MDNRYSNGKEQSWWQHLSVSSKVYSIMALVCLAIVGSVGYFVNASNPAKAGYFMMAICFFAIVVMWFGAIILRTIDTKNNEKLTEQANQTLEQAQETLKQVAQLSTRTQKMVVRDDARRQAEEDFLDTPDLDDDWEERAEELERRQQAEEETPIEALTPEQLEQLREELENYDPEKDRDAILNRRYARADGGKVVAILTRIHTGEIDVQLVKDILAGKTPETPASPEENSGDQPKNPTALPAPQPQFLLEQKSDPPQPLEQPSAEEEEYQSIEKQAAELGVKVAELKFYLRGKTHYRQMPSADLMKVKRLARMRA